MPEPFNTVVRNRSIPDEPAFHALAVAGLARVAAKHGRGSLADKMKRTTRALDKVFAGSTPDAFALFNALTLDMTALDEIAAAFGVQIIPAQCLAANDYELMADTAALLAEHTDAMRDGRRDHRETCRLADKARPVVAQFKSMIEEADSIRAA